MNQEVQRKINKENILKIGIVNKEYKMVVRNHTKSYPRIESHYIRSYKIIY